MLSQRRLLNYYCLIRIILDFLMEGRSHSTKNADFGTKLTKLSTQALIDIVQPGQNGPDSDQGRLSHKLDCSGSVK